MEQETAGMEMPSPEGPTNTQNIRPESPHTSVAEMSPMTQTPEPIEMSPQAPGSTPPGLAHTAGNNDLCTQSPKDNLGQTPHQMKCEELKQQLRQQHELQKQQLEHQQQQQLQYQMQQQQLQQEQLKLHLEQQFRILDQSLQQLQVQEMQQDPEMPLCSVQEPQMQLNEKQLFMPLASLLAPPELAPSQPAPPQLSPSQPAPPQLSPSQLAPPQPVEQTPVESSMEMWQTFLENIIKLSIRRATFIQKNMSALVQGLVGETEDVNKFNTEFEKMMDVSPQPCLIDFLKQSMALPGQSPAPVVNVACPTPEPQLPSLPSDAALSTSDTPNHGGRTAMHDVAVQTQPPVQEPVAGGSGLGNGNEQQELPSGLSPRLTPRFNIITPGQESIKGKGKGKKTPLKPSAPIDDMMMDYEEEFNAMAAEGSINLHEELQRIVGAQIRFCYEVLSSLTDYVREKLMERGMRKPAPEFVHLLCRVLDERLDSIIDELVSIVAHRNVSDYKPHEQWVVAQDVKCQMRLMEEVQRGEICRRQRTERDIVLRAANINNPQLIKLKAQAKERQRAELAEQRQRDANQTALQASGKRKKPRQEPVAGPSRAPHVDPRPTQRVMPRAHPRLITMQEMSHLLQNDRFYARILYLYNMYLRS